MILPRQVCSLGGGVASTALFLMSLHGEIENPAEAAVFADTGWERQSTLDTIKDLQSYAKGFDVPVYILRGANIRTNALDPTSKNGDLPFFTTNREGKQTQLRKFCTNEFKTYPIWRFFRSEFKAHFKDPVFCWLGYTMDEVHRMKPAKRKYIKRRYPLIEKRVYRETLYPYLEKYGFTDTAPSACIGCPFRRDAEYRQMPEHEIQDAITFETEINERGMITGELDSPLRLHRSLEPLSDRPFENEQTDMFDDDNLCGGGSCFT